VLCLSGQSRSNDLPYLSHTNCTSLTGICVLDAIALRLATTSRHSTRLQPGAGMKQERAVCFRAALTDQIGAGC
jgi:hypothetical protein